MPGNSTEIGNEANPPGLDTTGEFFSVGVALHAVRAGYIRRSADEQLYNAVMSGRYAHVVAPDHSGKSSLIAATAARLESNGCKVAILDLAQLGDRDGNAESGRWYYSVAYRLQRQLRVRYNLQSWWQDKTVLSNRQRLFEFYSEILLQHVAEPIVIFVDEIQCVGHLPYADELLTSIRAAHNARTSDPDFSRLSFVLLGECDPVSLTQQAELSPFNVTLPVLLEDFSRQELNLFTTELNMGVEDAATALDRIFYWTDGQPYLSQKLARAVARESEAGNVQDRVDRIAMLQIAGRAALHSEPHMSHIHRAIINDNKNYEALLNLYGKVRKGIEVAVDLGSALQRRLMAVGLLVIDENNNLSVRNRLYEMVFTARWANENLPVRVMVPVAALGALLLFSLIPFWYTQWLPNPYVRTLTTDAVALPVAQAAYENLRSFPGHADTADSLYRSFLGRRARVSQEESEIEQLSALALSIPEPGRLAEEFEAQFWDRKASLAARNENRDAALLSTLRSLALPTTLRRKQAALLVSDDFPYLLTTLPATSMQTIVFDPAGMLLTAASGAQISQYSYSPSSRVLQQRDPWEVTALEVNPLVRRVNVDRSGAVSRIGLTLNISHARLADLRIKIIAPSGRAVEVDSGVNRASDKDDIRIPQQQLREFVGESLKGTWSISVRDESLGVAGQLVGWNLKLNSQGAVEYFQRGLNIPDPVERATENIWFDPSGRYAVARAMQSDSARIWDLAFAEPIQTIALPESEKIIGLDAAARRLVTASQDRVNLWDTASGAKVRVLRSGAASSEAMLTGDKSSLFIERRSDLTTRLELWNLDSGSKTAQFDVAGVPALVAIDAHGRHVAIADFDRAVRVWDLEAAELLGQFDLPAQPGTISLSADGSALGVVYPNVGMSLWKVSDPQQPLMEKLGFGSWQLDFSPSGNFVVAGRPEAGYQVVQSLDGRLIGPSLGVRHRGIGPDLLTFSQDEKTLLLGSAEGKLRFWRVPVSPVAEATVQQSADHMIWRPAADRAVVAAQDGSFVVIGDTAGHAHIIASSSTLADLASISEDVSFVGHNSEVRLLAVSASGELVASLAKDNTLRLWRSHSGEPYSYVVEISGAPANQVEFSTDDRFVAVISDDRVAVVNVSDGSIAADVAATSAYRGMAFTTDNRLYFGAEDGSLQLLRFADDNNWRVQQVWQGTEEIRTLKAAPMGDYLILVDRKNVASKFFLAEGRIGDATLSLPSNVQEVAFDNNGTRAYFRTSRWLHQASSSITGLSWMNALLVPAPVRGAGIVHGNGSPATLAGRKLYLPVASDGYIKFAELDFKGSATSGLFGSQKRLLQEWGARVNAIPLEGS